MKKKSLGYNCIKLSSSGETLQKQQQQQKFTNLFHNAFILMESKATVKFNHVLVAWHLNLGLSLSRLWGLIPIYGSDPNFLSKHFLIKDVLQMLWQNKVKIVHER